MADFGGNLVGWEGCVCEVQGICDHCKGKLRGDLKQSGTCFFMADRAYFRNGLNAQ